MGNLRKIGLICSIFFLTFVYAGYPISVYAQEEGFTETFDDPELPGWDRTSGVESVDGVLFIEPNNFATHPGSANDMEMTLSLRRNNPGGFVIGFNNAKASGYIVLIADLSIILQRESGGKVDELTKAVVPDLPVGEWFELTITAFGGDLTISINGKSPALVYNDPSPLPPGRIALETFQECSLEVDQITLTGPGEVEPQPDSETSRQTETPSTLLSDLPTLPWVSTGGPSGGLGYDIRMDPRDPNTMYVTDALAGAFKSTDGGSSWFQINEGISARVGPSGDGIPVFSLTVDPNNPEIIWAGTQFGGGVFRSGDGGKSWTAMGNGIQERGLTIRGFSVEPGNSEVVYLAGEISSWEWNIEPLNGIMFDLTKGAVYQTTNSGKNWSRIWIGDNLARYVLIHPDDHDLLYVSTGIFDREAANSNPETLDPGGVGVLRSKDGGVSWEELGVNYGFRAEELYIGSLAMHPTDPDIMFAAAGSDAHLYALNYSIGAIYRTLDGGDSWERVLEQPNASAVEVCESDPNVIYSGSASAIYRSDDGGTTWQLVNGSGDRLDRYWGPDEYLGGFPIDMQCDLTDPMRIFVNNYGGGNFLSNDGGLHWSSVSEGYTGAIMRTVITAPGSPGLVFGSARSGIFVSYDGGENWSGMSRGITHAMEAEAITVDPFDHLHIVSVVEDAGPFPKISYDGGLTWQEASHNVKNSESFYWDGMNKIAFSPITPGNLIGIQGQAMCYIPELCESGFGVVYSSDGGKSWALSNIKEGMGTDLNFALDGTAYVILYPDDLYRSIDGGENWTLVSENTMSGLGIYNKDPDMPGPLMSSIAVDPEDSTRLYAGFARAGLAVSEDGGSSWKVSSAGMIPETSIIDLAVDKAHPGVIYAASFDSGVYRSMDSGASWQAINEGLSNRAGVSLSLSEDGSYLYLATEGGGVFRLSPGGKAPPAAESPIVQDVTSTPIVDQNTEEVTSPDQGPSPESDNGKSTPMSIPIIGILIGVGIIIIVVVISVRRRQTD